MLACVHLVVRGIQCSCDQRVDFDAQVVSDRGKRICRGEDAPGSTRCRKFPAMRTRPQRWRVAPASVASCNRGSPAHLGQNFCSGDIFALGAALDPAGPRDPPLVNLDGVIRFAIVRARRVHRRFVLVLLTAPERSLFGGRR
jgi:hypothetical protein